MAVQTIPMMRVLVKATQVEVLIRKDRFDPDLHEDLEASRAPSVPVEEAASDGRPGEPGGCDEAGQAVVVDGSEEVAAFVEETHVDETD